MSKVTIYEHPLSERIRTLLRLEYLFKQLQHFHHGESHWDSRILISTLFDLLEMFSRADLKTELLKEIERASNNLKEHLEHPQVDHKRLTTILRALEGCSTKLYALRGPLGQCIKDDPFLATIRQRSSIPGGSCDFDLPGYHQWLGTPREQRRDREGEWLKGLAPIQQTAEILLKLIRSSTEPRSVVATGGQYQQSLDTSLPYQMIRLYLPVEAHYYAEISGGKHRFTVRFLEQDRSHSTPITDDVPFQISFGLL